MPKKTIIHVNQHIIKANNKILRECGDECFDELNPPLTIKDYQNNQNGNRADIIVDGKIVASVVHSPAKPLSCGARVWIETYNDVKVTV